MHDLLIEININPCISIAVVVMLTTQHNEYINLWKILIRIESDEYQTIE